jgi:nucleotide-binding universal stress UspA family protein
MKTSESVHGPGDGFRRLILVGVDGSPASLGALRWASSVGSRLGADLLCVRADVPDCRIGSTGADAVLRQDALDELRAECAQLVHTRKWSALVMPDPPAEAILALADEHDPYLTVVGTTRAGGLSGELWSTAQRLCHRTSRPLAVIPERVVGPVTHIVVGIDGSPGSEAATRFCRDIAPDLAVPVVALYAFDPLLEWVPANDPGSIHRTVAAQARGWAEPILATDVPCDVVVERDIHPATALARHAGAIPGGMVVVGAQHLGRLTGLRLGEVPIRLLHRSTTPVTIVPTT